MALVYWSADGGGKVGKVPKALFAWIRANGSPDLIVYGGDIYNHGKTEEFEKFFDQIGQNVTNLCETAGNHDWDTTTTKPATGKIPSEYEAFWSRFAPPASAQPIDTTKKGGARYEHFRDIGGWRLIFIDTGPCNSQKWPIGDPTRVEWLKKTIKEGPGRSQIVFGHHGRLSKGKHGDNETVDVLWQTLFDPLTSAPLVAMTLSGHDHNVSMYGPRPKTNPDRGSVAFSKGIHVVVNGAGGEGHDRPFDGTTPDLFFDEDNFCITRINLLDNRSADVEILSFGTDDPLTETQPKVLHTLQIRI